MACFTNPIKNRLLLTIDEKGRATAKELARSNINIPQATLYRYLKKMVEDGILEVVEEKPVRNVKERVYGIAIDIEAELGSMVEENPGKGYFSLFQQFTTGLLNEFQAYAEKDDIDLEKDGSGFFITPFYATTEELEELALELRTIILAYHEKEPAPGRQVRNIAVILTPPTAI